MVALGVDAILELCMSLFPSSPHVCGVQVSADAQRDLEPFYLPYRGPLHIGLWEALSPFPGKVISQITYRGFSWKRVHVEWFYSTIKSVFRQVLLNL